MTPEQVIDAVVIYAEGVYDESEVRGWLDQPGECMDKLPEDLRICVWSIELQRTARDVMLSFPYWITVPEFLDFWNYLSIAERLAYMASDFCNENTSCGCGCRE